MSIVAAVEDGAVLALEGAQDSTGSTAQAVVRENGEPVKFGVTDPISLGMPTKAEIALTEQLQEEMRRDSPLESQEKMRFRASVLVELHRLIKQWIYEVSVQNGFDEASARAAGAKIFTFGSYRLGLISPGSDIDALCVAPRHVSRNSFFQVLVSKLQEHPDIEDLTPVPDAYVPIIKMKLSGVDIDLLFARLTLTQIPEDLESLNDDTLLKNLDDPTVRSLNGCRVADHILSLVPDADRYRDTLRLIKIWAKRRGLYSNVLGFFGGITWAILVARVCQLYPYYNAAALVKRFFRLYDRWNWKNPVCICNIREPSNVPGLSAFKIWNPKVYPQDRMHIMPVITPAFPSMNSTHNVSESTKRILLDELARGYKVVEMVEKGKCTWSEVYRPLPFFAQHRHYLHIEILAKSAPVFTKWSGWIESKLRFLVKQLEQIPGVQVRPWPNHLEFEDSDWPQALAVFMGLTTPKKGSIDLTKPVTTFVEIINSWPDRPTYEGQTEMRVRDVKRGNLPSYVPEDGRKPKTARSNADAAADAVLALAAEAAAEGVELPAAAQPLALAPAAVAAEPPSAGEAAEKRQRLDVSGTSAQKAVVEPAVATAGSKSLITPGRLVTPGRQPPPTASASTTAAAAPAVPAKRKLGKIAVKLGS
eukprot:TRINITY_DN3381_c4_g1_i1.p1 TRINITY_DN3381_c4_g1~~TRINITY_DN3381_c4_g1_i1.p1  ORF type:complete len:647 (+),score=126.73 TRINITY_DN3381_c4_g1_i1:76-2016(+)